MLKFYRTNLLEKLEEALRAVIPIILIVLFLCFTIAPLSPGLLMVFLIGAVLLVVGMMFFTLGADLAMTPIGERVGTAMTQSRKLAVIIPLAFLLGVIITFLCIPSATNATNIAYLYGGNHELASSGVMLSTLLSMLTMPVLLQLLFG